MRRFVSFGVVGIIKAFLYLIEPAINAIEFLQPTAILMRADVAFVSPAEGTILRKALHNRISDQIGSDEIRLFEFICVLADLASGLHDALVTEIMPAWLETHWIAQHHVADRTNQVLG